ncbi:MAG: Ni/Fe-hydrogenase cytochrome b subunit [Candidatus Omnitrophica bacterium]|nr:Ni/Fe-hydrogenase cytochrome b subunit [Candidatus Omnitrophota bacterium]
MNKRLIVKSILWAFASVGLVVAWARFSMGLGATTALTDDTPWGLWIAFDVMGGVALAAGGFVIAAAVYIFHLEKYSPILRPAVLTAFLGYTAVVIGLLFDLGLPWRIWHATIFWQHHSVLFEVAWCVMLYLTVLALEFAPVALEHPYLQWPILQRIHKLLKWLTVPLVITGIMLSTLHQSSLGSLFLIMPYRLHALWYTPIIPALFFVSAVGLGLMMVTLEAFASSWLFHHKIKTDLLAGLAKAASIVLYIYLAIRFVDLAVHSKLGYLFEGSWQSALFLFEISISALIPAVLLSFSKIRHRLDALFACSLMVVFGMVLNRLNVGIIAIEKSPGNVYFPTWMEISISLAIVSGAALVYIFCAENFRLFTDEKEEKKSIEKRQFEQPVFDAPSKVWLGDSLVQNISVFSIIVVSVISITAAMLPSKAISGYERDPVPVRKAVGWETIKIDGNRTGEFVLFNHKEHEQRLEKIHGEREGCLACHHASIPQDGPTGCYECHSDMHLSSNIFDHEFHQKALQGNQSCTQCHAEGQSKSRESSIACTECHQSMFQKIDTGKADYYIARSYMNAMHDLCIPCHQEQSQILGDENIPKCAFCHVHPPQTNEDRMQKKNVDAFPFSIQNGEN